MDMATETQLYNPLHMAREKQGNSATLCFADLASHTLVVHLWEHFVTSPNRPQN